jgi:PAS domain S-box-containing protein
VNEDIQKGEIDRGPANDDLLRLIIDSAMDFAIFSMDERGFVTSWNSGAERVLGFDEKEILGQSADIIFTSEDRLSGVPNRERQQASASGRAEDDRWTLRKDGSRFWASGLAMPLRDPSLGFVKILRDRTKEHLAEAQVHESEGRFRLLATSIPQLVFRTRLGGARTWGSPQWIDFTGLSLDESLGLGWLNAVHPDDLAATQAAWEDSERTGKYYVEHRILRAADGEYRWHQTRARPVESVGDADWVGTMTDIHDLRTMKDRQDVLMAELQHRTRNLLAVVQAMATQTRRNSASLETFGAEFEDRLRALGRVQSLLARVDHEDVDLRELVSAELLAHSDVSLTGRVHFSGPSVPLPAISAQTISLAIHELVTNAVKYGALSQRTGRLDVTWRVETNDGKRRAVLDWIESGVYMPQNLQQPRKGYGTELIERALPYQLGAETNFRFGADGILCTINVPLNGESPGGNHG